MAVVMVVVGVGFERGRGGAAVGGLAAADLELDGGVGDVEAVAQGAVDGVENAGALGDGHLGDGDVAGEGVGGGAERPDVEVVDVEDAGDAADGGADAGRGETARGVPSSRMLRVSRTMVTELQRIMPAMMSERTGSIHIMPVKRMASAAGDDGGGGERVAQHVEEDGADVDVAGELPEQGGDGAVHQDAGGGDVHHQAGLHGDGGVEAMDGGDGDPGGEDDEGEGVDEGGEDAGALVAEGLLVGGGAALEVDGDEGEQDGEHVGDVVAGLGDEGEGVGAQAEVEGGEDIGRGERHRELSTRCILPGWTGDHVHK